MLRSGVVRLNNLGRDGFAAGGEFVWRADRTWRGWLFVGVLCVGWAGVAGAQGPVDAAIRGHVTAMCGPSAHACFARGAHVRLVADGAVVRELDADATGDFVVQRLPPGNYRVEVKSSGADGSVAVAAATLEGGETIDVSLQLGLGPVVVPEKRGVVTRAEVGEFSELPVESRRWESLVELDSEAAAATAVPVSSSDADDEERDDPASRRSARDGEAAGGLSYGGLAPIENSMTVDGLSGEQNFRAGPRGAAGGGPSSGSSYSQGAMRSFRVLPHTFSAQYGGGGGGLAVVSRAGSTGAHGNVFFSTRDSLLAATNPFSVETHYRDGVVTTGLVKPAGSLRLFGGTVGLPLSRVSAKYIPTRLGKSVWLFGSLEAQVRADRVVSTPAMPNFYELSAGQMALLGNRGVSTVATNAALDYLDSLTGTTARSATRVRGFGRVDALLSAHDRVALSYAGNRFISPAGIALGQASDAVVARGRGSLGDSRVVLDTVAGRWLHTFSDRWNNEVRAQVARDLEYETPHDPLAQEPGIGPGGYAPQVSIAPNGFAYGTPSSLAAGTAGGRKAYPDEWRVEVADSMQLQMKKHLLTVGGDWSRIHDRIEALSNAEGSFSYDSGTTGGRDGGLVDWITDYTFNVHAYPNGACPSINAAVHDFCFRSFTQSFGSTPTDFVTHTLAAFGEDALRVRSDLTVTVGVRFEYTLLPLPQNPNAALDEGLAGLDLRVSGATSRFPEDRNNFGPRLSAVWSPQWLFGWPRGRRNGALFTVHVGYGLFFGRIPGATVRAALTDTALPSTTLRVRIRPTTETLCPQVTDVQQGFGYPCAFVSAPPAAVAQTSSAMVFASGYRVPAVQRATLAIEREVGRRILLRASYAMAMGEQLPSSTDVNIAASTGYASYVLQGGDGHVGLHDGEAFVVPRYTQRLLSGYGPVTALVSNSNATYHAATAEAQLHGFAKGPLRSLQLRGSYTFSRAIDYAPQSSAVPGVDGQFDPYRNGYDKGLSNQQFPQRFAGSLIYKTSVAGGQWLVREALDGWRFAAIGVAGSGAPYSYQIFGGDYLRGGRETINGSGGATYLPTIGRNTLRLPARGRVDLRVSRDFLVPLGGLRGRVRLNVFGDAFNLANSVNRASVETRAFLVGTAPSAGGPVPLIFQDATAIAAEGLTTPAFGAPRSSTTGLARERQIEVGVRLQF